MRIEFKERFKRDIKKIKEREIKNAVLSLISTIEKSSKPQDIPHIIKTHCNKDFYRFFP